MVLLISTFYFRNPHYLIDIVPNYSSQGVLDMIYHLGKYREGIRITNDTPSSELIYFFNMLQRDVKEKNIDPYPYKLISYPAQN